MARITAALIPLIDAADNLTEQARDLLQLHRQEVPRSFPVIATLEAAMDALDEARDSLEQSRPTTCHASQSHQRKDHAMTNPTALRMIPVEEISPSPLNPRWYMG